jgi:DNA-directed RNA polymerase subunit H (RpoH/RPB5)
MVVANMIDIKVIKNKKIQMIIIAVISSILIFGMGFLYFISQTKLNEKEKRISALLKQSDQVKIEYLKITKEKNHFIMDNFFGSQSNLKILNELVSELNQNKLISQKDFDSWDINQTRLNNFIAEVIIFSEKTAPSELKKVEFEKKVLPYLQNIDRVSVDLRKKYHDLVFQIQKESHLYRKQFKNYRIGKNQPIFKAEAFWYQHQKNFREI